MQRIDVNEIEDELEWLGEFSEVYGFQEEEMIVDRLAYLKSILEEAIE